MIKKFIKKTVHILIVIYAYNWGVYGYYTFFAKQEKQLCLKEAKKIMQAITSSSDEAAEKIVEKFLTMPCDVGGPKERYYNYKHAIKLINDLKLMLLDKKTQRYLIELCKWIVSNGQIEPEPKCRPPYY